MKYDCWQIPVRVVVSLFIFFTRFGLLGAVVNNKPNGSAPITTEARYKGWPHAIAAEVLRRELSVVVGYWSHWHHDYFSREVTVLRLDPWSRRPLISFIPTFGRDRFSLIRLNATAVVLLPPLRVLLLTLWWFLAAGWWRQWQRERWIDDIVG